MRTIQKTNLLPANEGIGLPVQWAKVELNFDKTLDNPQRMKVVEGVCPKCKKEYAAYFIDRQSRDGPSYCERCGLYIGYLW